jgi:ElaB/YqjD/DUF883 family membrane-anchored ribosome-binding protein
MQPNTDKLTQDLRAVIGDVEELLKATADQSGERIQDIRARAEKSVRVARERLHAAADDFNGSVRENPWTAVGVAAGVGLLAGLILARK